MVRDVVTERPDADILDAAKLMIDHDISALPVLDDGRQLIGILSEADLLHRPARLSPLAFFALRIGSRKALQSPFRLAMAAADSPLTLPAQQSPRVYEIAVTDANSFFDLASIRFERLPPEAWVPVVTIFRPQLAGGALRRLLHDLDPERFATFLDQIEDGVPFKTAFEASFGASAKTRWSEFAEAVGKRPSTRPAGDSE